MYWNSIVSRYQNAINEGPVHVCHSCGGLRYKSSVKAITRDAMRASNVPENVIQSVFHVDRTAQEANFCLTSCTTFIKLRRIPQLCLANGLDYPVIPPVLKTLTRLEERLVAPRHVFQTIYTVMGASWQYRAKGAIVNVPVCIDTTVSSLPRAPMDTQMHVVHFRLARCMQYLHDYADGNVRAQAVRQAAAHLTEQPLYREHRIMGNLIGFIGSG